ncbi:MAG: hypothetical protein J6Y27_04395 [Bacteroidales bacterium]|nr:hypothetical protein [Bacteroidales bacterium]
MKRLAYILLTFVVSLPLAFAQPGADIQRILSQMPVQTAAELNTAVTQLAQAAPGSVLSLAAMLQSADKGANSPAEYALSALANFASDKNADINLRKAVKTGFQQAVAATADPTNKQFLQAQLRLLSPEKEKVPIYKSKNDKKVEKLWKKANPVGVVKALKSDDPAYRVTALRTADAFAGPVFYRQLEAAYPTLSEDAKAEIIYWLGLHKADSEADFILSQLDAPGQTGLNAVEAAGKIGGAEAAEQLVSMLNGPRAEAAYAALQRFNGDVRGTLKNAFKDASGKDLIPLMKLAAERRMSALAPNILKLAAADDAEVAAAARNALAGVVRSDQVNQLAKMLDGADEAAVKPLQAAFAKALAKSGAPERYSLINTALSAAKNKDRFYPALAGTDTENAVKDLAAAYENGSKSAFDALMTMSNAAAAPLLLKEGGKGNAAALTKALDLVAASRQPDAEKLAQYIEAAGLTKDSKTLVSIVNKFAAIPTPESFDAIVPYLDNADKSIAYAAANAAAGVAQKCAAQIDKARIRTALTKASAILAATGDADDGYAVDAIRQFLSTL